MRPCTRIGAGRTSLQFQLARARCIGDIVRACMRMGLLILGREMLGRERRAVFTPHALKSAKSWSMWLRELVPKHPIRVAKEISVKIEIRSIKAAKERIE